MPGCLESKRTAHASIFGAVLLFVAFSFLLTMSESSSSFSSWFKKGAIACAVFAGLLFFLFGRFVYRAPRSFSDDYVLYKWTTFATAVCACVLAAFTFKKEEDQPVNVKGVNVLFAVTAFVLQLWPQLIIYQKLSEPGVPGQMNLLN